MTTRERWLLTGLIIVTALLPVLGIWQQVRYRNAERAVQEFIQLEERTEKSDASQVVLIRRAQPDIRGSLSRGDFNAALQRITALQEEDRAPEDVKNRGKSIAIDKLWPRGTPARKQAQQVLRLVAQKQSEGYDITAAHDALIRVADAARSGKKKEALTTFKQVEMLARNAPVRPGFRAREQPASLNLATTTGQPAMPVPGQPPLRFRGQRVNPAKVNLSSVTPAQVEQFLQFFQLALPQIMERAKPQQREFLRRLQPFGNEMATAYRQGKDIGPVIVLLQRKIGPAMQSGDQQAAENLLTQAQILLRSAKPFARGATPPAGRMPSGNAGAPVRMTLPPGVLKRMRRGLAAGTTPQGLPPADSGMGRPGRNRGLPPMSPETLLQALDTIRKLPEPIYQQQRPQIARLIGQAISGMSNARPLPERSKQLEAPKPDLRATVDTSNKPVTPRQTSTTFGVGNAAKVRLQLGANGEIVGLYGLGQELSNGLTPGGFSLVSSDRNVIPLQGTLRKNGSAVTGAIAMPGSPKEVRCNVTYESEGRDITIKGQVHRDRAGSPATLQLRIPLRAAGWHWDAGESPQVIAVDGQYATSATADKNLNLVTLRGANIRLALSAPTASSITYESASSSLLARFPVSSDKGISNILVQMTVSH